MKKSNTSNQLSVGVVLITATAAHTFMQIGRTIYDDYCEKKKSKAEAALKKFEEEIARRSRPLYDPIYEDCGYEEQEEDCHEEN